MSQAKRTRHFVRSARRGEKKNKAPVTSSSFRLQVLTDGGDVKSTNQNTIHYSKILTFLATRNTDNSIEHRKNNVRLSAAKVRFAQSKFSYVQTRERKEKEKRENVNSKVTSL